MLQSLPQTQGKDYVLMPMPDEMIPWCAHCRDHTEFQSWYGPDNDGRGLGVIKYECLTCKKPMHKPYSCQVVGFLGWSLFAASLGVLFVLFLIGYAGWQPLCLLAIMTFLIWRWHRRSFYYEWKKWSEELLKDPNNKSMVIGNKTVIAKGQSTPPT